MTEINRKKFGRSVGVALPPKSKSAVPHPASAQLEQENKQRRAPSQPPTAKNVASVTQITRRFQGISIQRNNYATSSRSEPPASKTVPPKNFSDIAQLILNKSVSNVVAVVGAGISTPSGIPDFRTPGSGLYSKLKAYSIPYPEAIFDIDFFRHSPKPFFHLAKELYPGNFRPNLIHYFLRLLHDHGVLRRVYTQNIDGLELQAGVPEHKLVEAHGHFRSASCIRCKRKQRPDQVRAAILADKIPRCEHCKSGVVKPDIVFFGEDLPDGFNEHEVDVPKADMLIVMGTSLQVEPFAGIVRWANPSCPRILINRTAVGPFEHRRRQLDAVFEGDLLSNVTQLVASLGWTAKVDGFLAADKARGPTPLPIPAAPVAVRAKSTRPVARATSTRPVRPPSPSSESSSSASPSSSSLSSSSDESRS